MCGTYDLVRGRAHNGDMEGARDGWIDDVLCRRAVPGSRQQETGC